MNDDTPMYSQMENDSPEPEGRIQRELRDTKMAVDDAFHMLGELNAKLMPILGPDMRTETSNPEEIKMKSVSSNSEFYDYLHAINQRVYEFQGAIRGIAERLEL